MTPLEKEMAEMLDQILCWLVCYGAVERAKEHGNMQAAENVEADTFKVLMLLEKATGDKKHGDAARRLYPHLIGAKP